MGIEDRADIYIKGPGHPRYVQTKTVVTDLVESVIDKIEMVLFTRPGDVLGHPEFGADIERLLWSTRLSADAIRSDLLSQYRRYVLELRTVPHDVQVYVVPGTLQDIGVIDTYVDGVKIRAVFD